MYARLLCTFVFAVLFKLAALALAQNSQIQGNENLMSKGACPMRDGADDANSFLQMIKKRRIHGGKKCCDTQANDAAACNALQPFQFEGTMLKGVERMICPNELDGRCSFDNCIGGTGVDCEGVSTDLHFGKLGSITIDLVRPVDAGNGKVTLKTSVGSILHDLCCMIRPWGAFCDSSNYPYSETINLIGIADNDCDCLLEWRKAVRNLLMGRYWMHDFEIAMQSQDTSFDHTVNRQSWLPLGSAMTYLNYKSNWGITERKATSGLCAPAGTKLDCPGEDNNCKVPCGWVTCKACAEGCGRLHRKRWNDGRDHENAGDSDYCCSGKFKEVYFSVATRYGTCA